MNATEKYAELEARGIDRPLCECHAEPMTWQKSTPHRRSANGGAWICRVVDRDRSRAWRAANPGRPRPRSPRRPQTDAVARERRVARNREFVASEVAQRGSVCCDCGRPYEDGRMFHWHHRRPEDKVFSVANGVIHNGIEAVRAEIAKCDLICAHCHPTRQALVRREAVAS